MDEEIRELEWWLASDEGPRGPYFVHIRNLIADLRAKKKAVERLAKELGKSEACHTEGGCDHIKPCPECWEEWAYEKEKADE